MGHKSITPKRHTRPLVKLLFVIHFRIVDTIISAAKSTENGLTNVPPKRDSPAGNNGTLRFSGYLRLFT